MKNFLNPENEFRGTDFFMLNDALSCDELAFQIDEMAKKGVASFIARTYVGLKSDYPGPEFMSKMAVMISEAKKHGMTVFVQAGYMPEAVLDLPSECALEYLCVHSDGVCPADETIVCEYDGTVYSRKSSVTCLNLFDHDAVEFYIHQSYDLWQPFKDEFGKTISSIWVDEPSYHGEHLPWYESFDRVFFEKYGYDIKSNVYKLYRDVEDYKKIRYDYWTLLNKLLENCYFSMIRDWCNENGLLFSGHLMMEDTLFTQIKRSCAVMPYYKYFDIPGLDILRGYMNWKNDPIKDFNGTEFFDEHMYTTPIQTVSAAHQAGKDKILCEMYGVTTNGMGFRDFEYYFDHFASLGVNYRSVHGIFYSLKGRSKRMYPPHVNYYQPYWPKYRNVTDYCARTSQFISFGKPYANVLVLHPLETAYLYFRGADGEPLPSEEMSKLDKQFSRLLRSLLFSHISFELGDLNTVSSGYAKIDAENKKFTVGKMSYDTVVVPYLEVITPKTLELLSDFVSCGGKVVFLGGFPHLLDGQEFDIHESCLCKCEVVAGIPELCKNLTISTPEEYSIQSDKACGNIRVYHTKEGDNLHYMLFNASCTESQNVVLTVKGNFDAHVYDAETGKIFEKEVEFDGKQTSVSLFIAEGANVLVHLSKSKLPERSFVAQCKAQSILSLDNTFDISRKNENVLLLEYCSFKTEQMSEFEGDYTVLAINRILTDADYHGKLVQKFTFNANRPFTGLSLALEDALGCEVYLNGEKAKSYDGKSYYFAKAFCKIKLPDTCLSGKNVIEVRRNFVPLSKAKSSITSLFETQRGVELESMYLLGDFGVYSVAEPTMNGNLRYSKDFVLDDEKKSITGELTSRGFVFYCGTVSLKKSFKVDFASINQAQLIIGDFHGCVAQINVNGINCADMYKPPYTVDITNAVKCGENELEILLTNTLRPILGPYHRPKGEVGECWGGYGDPDLSWTGSALGADWYKNTFVDSSIWTDSYNQVRFGIGEVKIIIS